MLYYRRYYTPFIDILTFTGEKAMPEEFTAGTLIDALQILAKVLTPNSEVWIELDTLDGFRICGKVTDTCPHDGRLWFRVIEDSRVSINKD